MPIIEQDLYAPPKQETKGYVVPTGMDLLLNSETKNVDVVVNKNIDKVVNINTTPSINHTNDSIAVSSITEMPLINDNEIVQPTAALVPIIPPTTSKTNTGSTNFIHQTLINQSKLKSGVGKYKIYKSSGSGKDKVCYFLRCLWYLMQDPNSNHVIYWHPEEKDKFIIPNEKNLEEFLVNYDGFKMTLNSLRRSLYFYGFKKMKSIWYHQNLDNTDRNSLTNIKRRSNTKKKKKLQEQYMKYMIAQMSCMQQQYMRGGVPAHYPLAYGSNGTSPHDDNVNYMHQDIHAAGMNTMYDSVNMGYANGVSPQEYAQYGAMNLQSHHTAGIPRTDAIDYQSLSSRSPPVSEHFVTPANFPTTIGNEKFSPLQTDLVLESGHLVTDSKAMDIDYSLMMHQ